MHWRGILIRNSGILEHMKPSMVETRLTASCESHMYLESGGVEHRLPCRAAPAECAHQAVGEGSKTQQSGDSPLFLSDVTDSCE